MFRLRIEWWLKPTSDGEGKSEAWDASAQVVGQPQALQVVADAVRVARAGLQPAERPLGVFLFVGPTGVGKTQLTKALAQQLFDSEEV